MGPDWEAGAAASVLAAAQAGLPLELYRAFRKINADLLDQFAGAIMASGHWVLSAGVSDIF